MSGEADGRTGRGRRFGPGVGNGLNGAIAYASEADSSR